MPAYLLCLALCGELPTGVYWPGEATWNTAPDRWTRVASDLETLRSRHVNAVWLTHLSAIETAQFAGLASARGISVVAALAELDGSVAWQRRRTQDQMDQLCQTIRAEWGSAPLPLAWGLGDEPPPTAAAEMQTYLSRFQSSMPGDPATCTVTRGAVPAFKLQPWPVLTANVFPFFAPGAAGYPDGPLSAWLTTTADVAAHDPCGWTIGQAFSQPNNFLAPTPAQVRWQVYSALAQGCRGVFLFCWRYSGEGIVPLNQLPDQLGAADGAYQRVEAWSPILEQAASLQAMTCSGPDGSLAALVTGGDRRQYVLAVCGPGQSGSLQLKVPQGRRLVGVSSGVTVRVRKGEATLTLSAGDADLFQLQ